VGIVILAPDGPTAGLGIDLAAEMAGAGTRTWLLAGRASRALDPRPELRLTHLPDLSETLASLAAVVPLQLVAAELARRVDRGVTAATK
jgi:fructoselysine-6-P-deglycase FrlB-like protein